MPSSNRDFSLKTLTTSIGDIYLLLNLENLERKESISFEDYTIEHVHVAKSV